MTVLISTIFTVLFFGLSQVGATSRCGAFITRLLLKLFKALYTVRTASELKPKHPLDSDRALCFYLVGFYHSNHNKARTSSENRIPPPAPCVTFIPDPRGSIH